MTRIMYDSTIPSLIPADAQMVAGYVSGRYPWTKEEWARFEHVPRIRIDVTGGVPFLSDVVDCETGDLTPAGAAAWCLERQNTHRWWSTVYVELSNWKTVQAACQHAGAWKVTWWIAEWDHKAVIPAGAVAKQFLNTTGFDVSVVDDGWFKTSAPGWSVP